MDYLHFRFGKFGGQSLGKMLGAIYGAVSASGAAEAYLQRSKSAVDIAAHGGIDHLAGVGEKPLHLSPLLEKLNDRSVETGKGFIPVIAAGVVHAAAVEHEAAAIAGEVFGIPFLIGETKHLDMKPSIGRGTTETG